MNCICPNISWRSNGKTVCVPNAENNKFMGRSGFVFLIAIYILF